MTEFLDLFTNVEPSSLSDLGDILAYQLFDQPKGTGSNKVCVHYLALVLDLRDLVRPRLVPGVYVAKTQICHFVCYFCLNTGRS